MASFWECVKYTPALRVWRDQRRAYMRWCEAGMDEPALDVRLTKKLTKRRKLSWRVERRHMRQLLRPGGITVEC